MQSSIRSDLSGWVGLVGAAGALVSVLVLAGCSGTVDPAVVKSGTGGNTGTGGSSPTGGATGSGVTALNCTGDNDGVSVIMVNCATTFCHIPGAANDGTAGGLDLTVDANIGSRLVGVTSVGTADNASKCMGNSTPYLTAGSNPATGLLIDKVTMTHPPCGDQMPEDAPFPLSTMQKNCLIQWATTLTSP
jgi:hypothetical protein